MSYGSVSHQLQHSIIRTFFGVVAVCALLISASVSASVLTDYVAKPDSSYAYTSTGVLSGNGYKIHSLRMTSQQWRAPGEVDQTEWKHAIAIVVPDVVASTTGMLWVTGGVNDDPLSVPASDIQLAVQIARASRSVVTVLAQIPNQPLFFDGEPAAYSEDTLVAYSWDKAMKTGDYTWAVYLPMVKSAVRAMDAVQSYLPTIGVTNNDFVAVGFSKRGATVWLTAAVDSRVRAIAPGVFDVLNLAPQLEHHFRAYGNYSPAIDDYVHFDVIRRLRIPEGRRLLDVVDPLSYRNLLTVPKFLINASGDQFFLPDSSQLYVDKLLGEALIRYVPNTDHSLSTSTGGVTDALFSLVSWYQSILTNTARPSMTWSWAAGRLTVVANKPVLAARLWQASNANARDFRKASIGEAWTSAVVAPNFDGSYTADVVKPNVGWQAVFVELVFQGPAGVPQTYSTPVFVSPEEMPFVLSDPVNDPKGRAYWDRQTEKALRNPSGSPLPGYFPFPVFGHYITSLADADSVFDPRRRARDGALQHCLATRLNIASHSLGWYSPVKKGHHTRYLWQEWNEAFEEYQSGQHERAKEICDSLNELGR